MRNLCVPCHKIHTDTNWKYAPYKSINGEKYGYFCSKFFKPSPPPEMVPQRIKDVRQEYAKSLMQPSRGGYWSKEYIDTYGTDKLNITKEEAKKARNVWTGDVLKSGWEKSK